MSVLSYLCHLSFSFANHLPLAGVAIPLALGQYPLFSYCPLPVFQQHSKADDAKPSAGPQSQRHCTSAANTFSRFFFCFCSLLFAMVAAEAVSPRVVHMHLL